MANGGSSSSGRSLPFLRVVDTLDMCVQPGCTPAQRQELVRALWQEQLDYHFNSGGCDVGNSGGSRALLLERLALCRILMPSIDNRSVYGFKTTRLCKSFAKAFKDLNSMISEPSDLTHWLSQPDMQAGSHRGTVVTLPELAISMAFNKCFSSPPPPTQRVTVLDIARFCQELTDDYRMHKSDGPSVQTYNSVTRQMVSETVVIDRIAARLRSILPRIDHRECRLLVRLLLRTVPIGVGPKTVLASLSPDADAFLSCQRDLASLARWSLTMNPSIRGHLNGGGGGGGGIHGEPNQNPPLPQQGLQYGVPYTHMTCEPMSSPYLFQWLFSKEELGGTPVAPKNGRLVILSSGKWCVPMNGSKLGRNHFVGLDTELAVHVPHRRRHMEILRQFRRGGMLNEEHARGVVICYLLCSEGRGSYIMLLRSLMDVASAGIEFDDPQDSVEYVYSGRGSRVYDGAARNEEWSDNDEDDPTTQRAREEDEEVVPRGPVITRYGRQTKPVQQTILNPPPAAVNATTEAAGGSSSKAAGGGSSKAAGGGSRTATTVRQTKAAAKNKSQAAMQDLLLKISQPLDPADWKGRAIRLRVQSVFENAASKSKIAELEKEGVMVQTKLDGDRMQAHIFRRAGGADSPLSVALFTKHGMPVEKLYSDVAADLLRACSQNQLTDDNRFILDGELVLVDKDGKLLPWCNEKWRYNNFSKPPQPPQPPLSPPPPPQPPLSPPPPPQPPLSSPPPPQPPLSSPPDRDPAQPPQQPVALSSEPTPYQQALTLSELLRQQGDTMVMAVGEGGGKAGGGGRDKEEYQPLVSLIYEDGYTMNGDDSDDSFIPFSFAPLKSMSAWDGLGHGDKERLQGRLITPGAYLKYMVFDILKLRDDDLSGLPCKTRWDKLQQTFAKDCFKGLTHVEVLKDCRYVHTAEELMQELKESVGLQLEGKVLKDCRSSYVFGRTNRMRKLKVRGPDINTAVAGVGFSLSKNPRMWGILTAVAVENFDPGDPAYIAYCRVESLEGDSRGTAAQHVRYVRSSVAVHALKAAAAAGNNKAVSSAGHQYTVRVVKGVGPALAVVWTPIINDPGHTDSGGSGSDVTLRPCTLHLLAGFPADIHWLCHPHECHFGLSVHGDLRPVERQPTDSAQFLVGPLRVPRFPVGRVEFNLTARSKPDKGTHIEKKFREAQDVDKCLDLYLERTIRSLRRPPATIDRLEEVRRILEGRQLGSRVKWPQQPTVLYSLNAFSDLLVNSEPKFSPLSASERQVLLGIKAASQWTALDINSMHMVVTQDQALRMANKKGREAELFARFDNLRHIHQPVVCLACDASSTAFGDDSSSAAASSAAVSYYSPTSAAATSSSSSVRYSVDCTVFACALPNTSLSSSWSGSAFEDDYYDDDTLHNSDDDDDGTPVVVPL